MKDLNEKEFKNYFSLNLDFGNVYEIKSDMEVMKQEFCTYGLEEKENKSYICSCSTNEFRPICQTCFQNCHFGGLKENHQKITEIKGVYDCACGKSGHNIREECPADKSKIKCFFSKLLSNLNNVEHPGFYIRKKDDHVICVFCIYSHSEENGSKIVGSNSLMDLYRDHPWNQNKKQSKMPECQCQEHQERNLIGLIFKFIDAVKDYVYKQTKMSNFNPNILGRLYDDEVYKKKSLSKFLYDFEVQRKNIRDVNKIKGDKAMDEAEKVYNVNFFKTTYEFAYILKTLSITLEISKNPNFSYYLNDIIQEDYQRMISKENEDYNEEEEDKEGLLKEKSEMGPGRILLDQNCLMYIFGLKSPDVTQQEQFSLNELQVYFETKFYFAELIYNLYFRRDLLEHNICITNAHAIVSMDVLQRYIYFVKAKKFKNFRNNSENNSKNNTTDFQSDLSNPLNPSETTFIDYILDQLAEMMKYKDTITLDDLKTPFIICNRIIKEFIKFNMISRQQTQTYFMHLQEALKLERNNQRDGNKKLKKIGENYIIKSIFYSLLYKNDEKVVRGLQGERKNEEGYSFVSDADNDLISDVFLSVVNSQKLYNEKRVQSLQETDVPEVKRIMTSERRNRGVLKFDFYVRKITDLMAGKGKFYIKSLKKIKMVNDDIRNAFMNNKDYLQVQNKIIDYLNTPSDTKGGSIFSRTCQIADDLLSLNKDYFHYKINITNYKKEVYRISTRIKALIDDHISAVPMKKKYHNVVESDFAESKDKNLRRIKEAAKFSNIFQAINGFLHIYAEFRMHADKDQVHLLEEDCIDLDNNRKLLTKDMMLNFLTYLYTILWDDHQSVPLMSIFNSKNFVVSFMECETFFFYFMENLMDAFFGKIVSGSKMDNLNFYASLVTEMIELIDFSFFRVDNSSSNIRSKKDLDLCLGKLFHHIGKCFKLCIKPLRNLNANKTRLIDLIQIILSKIHEIKEKTGNAIFNIQIQEFFQSLSSMNNSNLIPAYNYDKTLTSDETQACKTKYIYIENMLKNYFQLMNEIMNTDLSFFSFIIPSQHYLFSIEEIKNYLTKEASINLELTMRIFLNKNLFTYRINPKEIVDRRKLVRKFHEGENYYLKDEMFQFEGEIKSLESAKSNIHDKDIEIYNLKEKADYLIDLMELKPKSSHQISFFESVLKASKEIKSSLIKRRILLLTYFENAYVRSIYNLINQILFKGSKLQGEMTHKIHKLVFNFLKCIFFFYNEILYVDVMEDTDANELSLFESPLFDLYKFENLYMVFPRENPESGVKGEKDFIESYLLKNLKFDILKLKDNIKYFEIDEVLDIFYKHLQSILICDEMTRTKEKDREKGSQGKKFIDVFKYLVDKTLDAKSMKRENHICQRVIADYVSVSAKCTGTSRALIKAIHVSQNEHFDSLGINFYEYLYKKSLHSLTYANHSYKFVTQNRECETNLTHHNIITNFTLQNTYIFSIFNDLLYHDSVTGQKIFYEILLKQMHEEEEEREYIKDTYNEINKPLSYFIKFIKNTFFQNVFSTSLFECSKVYQIDRISNSNMICFQLTQECLKFIQNLCEGHNHFFQNLMFVVKINLANEQKVPMLNMIMELMIDILNHSHLKKESSIFYKNRLFKDFYTLTILYEKLGDLIIEMIQGTNPKNYNLFFVNMSENNSECEPLNLQKTISAPSLSKKKKDKASLHLIRGITTIGNVNFHSQFVTFEDLMKKMKENFKEGDLVLQKETTPYKIKLFQIMTNILIDALPAEENKPNEVVNRMLEIFKPEELIMYITFYFKVLILEYTNKKAFRKGEFEFNIDESHLVQMKTLYRDFKMKIGFDMYFKLGVYMYMYIIFTADKYNEESALKIRKYGIKLAEEYSTKSLIEKKLYKQIEKKRGVFGNEELNKEVEKKKRSKVQDKVQDKSVTQANSEIIDEYKAKSLSAAFFSDLIRKCEVVIRTESEVYFDMKELDKVIYREEGEKTNYDFDLANKNGSVKNVYFIVDHRCYTVEDKSIRNFFGEVERTTPSIKLKTFLDKVDVFLAEANYKQKISLEQQEELTQAKYNLFKSESSLNKFNFLISVKINLILIFAFHDISFFTSYPYYFILFICLFLIYSNIAFLTEFMIKKYKFILKMELTRQGIKKSETSKMKWKDWMRVYFLNTILSQENYLLLINILVPLLCICFNYAIVLFPLQLFTVVKFVDTIKDIVRAFTYKIDELLSMVGFLGILILFYANLGFFFMPQMFEMDVNNGEHINACDSLIDCFVTYFNFGVRSGGGIGDVIGPQPYSDTYWYVLRFVFDMIFYITVILLIMNMINGIIISTFGALREEQENKQEEMESKCFICSLSKSYFEKYKIDFQLHKTKEHHVATYVKYFIILLMTDDRELNSDESYIKKCLKNKDISFFPVLKAKSLLDLNASGEDAEDDEE